MVLFTAIQSNWDVFLISSAPCVFWKSLAFLKLKMYHPHLWVHSHMCIIWGVCLSSYRKTSEAALLRSPRPLRVYTTVLFWHVFLLVHKYILKFSLNKFCFKRNSHFELSFTQYWYTLMTSAKSLFPNKVPFTGTEGENFNTDFGDTQFTLLTVLNYIEPTLPKRGFWRSPETPESP